MDKIPRNELYSNHNTYMAAWSHSIGGPEIYIQSAPNNLNESYTFIGLGRAKTALKFKYEI